MTFHTFSSYFMPGYSVHRKPTLYPSVCHCYFVPNRLLFLARTHHSPMSLTIVRKGVIFLATVLQLASRVTILATMLVLEEQLELIPSEPDNDGVILQEPNPNLQLKNVVLAVFDTSNRAALLVHPRCWPRRARRIRPTSLSATQRHRRFTHAGRGCHRIYRGLVYAHTE
jgi:hypothetical protein